MSHRIARPAGRRGTPFALLPIVPADPQVPDSEAAPPRAAQGEGGEAGGAPASPPGWRGAPAGAVPYPYPPYPPPWEEDEIDLREYWRVLVRHRRMILTTTLAAAVIAAIVSFILPKTYTATARILPPKEQSSGGLAAALAGQLGGLASLAGASLGGATNADLMVGMLSSRAVTDRILDQFKLQEIYDTKYRVDAGKKLLANLDAQVDKKSGILTLSVDDHDPERAAAIANAFVDQLDQLSRHLNITEASRQRLFLEERLVQVNKDLANAEDALRAFQEKHGAIQVDEQAKAMIDLLGALKGELMAAQVQLGVTQRFASGNNADVDRVQTQITEIQSRIRDMEQGQGERSAGDIFLPTQKIPDLGLRYGRLLRDVKVQETVFELLTQQYELVKMQEAKDSPTIQVLDGAVVPEKKSKPKRSLVVVLTAMLALMGASTLAVIRSGSATDRQNAVA